MNYPFLDFEKLEKKFLLSREIISQKFESIVVIGFGGSTQGSKAINSFLNETRVFYIDHLHSEIIDKLLVTLNLEKTGFIFISKSGKTSETLSIFEYLIDKCKNKINISNHFFSLTEDKQSQLHDFSLQHSMKLIEHDPDIGGRFSIFSNTSLIPGFYFNSDLCKNFLEGGREAMEEKGLAEDLADQLSQFMKNNKNIAAYLIYGHELLEVGNWKKQLFAESLGKNGKGFMPVVSEMTKDQHSILQLFLDGPKNVFFEIMSMESDKVNLINMTLSNHMSAMNETLIKQGLKPRISIFKENDVKELGFYFCIEILTVIFLAKLLNVDPFVQEAIELQKNNLS